MSDIGMRVLAVDLGATSVRVASVDLAAPAPQPEVLHRWFHGPVEHPDGSLRWDWDGIVSEVVRGLEAALAAGPVASIGVDGWAVDYGLLDAAGRLVAPPWSYRDRRTEGWRRTAEQIGEERLYAVTGIQLMPINTIFQLAAHDRAERDRATRMLLLPDLLVHHLTGHLGAERSNASTTALMDASTGDWSSKLADEIGIDVGFLPPITTAGRRVGTWRDTPVHLVGSHDTASAFVAAPGVVDAATAVVSCGTWVLVGAERPAPDTSPAARAANFSNEWSASDGIRFLKNITGFWLLEQCRDRWGNPPIEDLVTAAAGVTSSTPLFDPTDERFLSPDDMEAEVRAAAGLPDGAGRPEVVRCILESIAAATARVVDELGTITGIRVGRLFVVGGGARLGFMNELLAGHTGRPVTVGSPEATAVGNAVVQGLTLRRFTDLDDGRRWVAGDATEVDVPAGRDGSGLSETTAVTGTPAREG